MFSHYLTLREQHSNICQVILVYLNTTTVKTDKTEKEHRQQFPHPLSKVWLSQVTYMHAYQTQCRRIALILIVQECELCVCT